MLEYPELASLTILILISLFVLGMGFHQKHKITIKYASYFLLIFIFESIRIAQFYLKEPAHFDFVLFIFLLCALNVYSKEINQHLFSTRYGLYTLIAAFITYPLLKYAIEYKLLILIWFTWFTFHLVIFAVVIAYIEISVYKYESFSFINLILTPSTFFIIFFYFHIEGNPNLVIQKVTKTPTIINNLWVTENTHYVHHAYHQDDYFQLSFSDKEPYLWHGIKVSKLTNVNILEELEYNKNSGKLRYKYNYLVVNAKEDAIIHNRLCSHKSLLYFRFLSENDQDWSEENTEFESCTLVDNSPLNKMKILNNLGENIRLYYRPLKEIDKHPRILYEHPIFSNEIKWFWAVRKMIKLFPEIETNIVGLYLDDNRRLLAIHMHNILHHDENIKIGDCELTTNAFREMLIVNVGNDPVTAIFPKLYHYPECQNLQLEIKQNLIFDYIPNKSSSFR